MGVSLARKAGLIVTLISGEDSPLVDRFAAKMNLTDITKGCKDKAGALAGLRRAPAAWLLEEICFMGDDVNDLAAMELAGLAAAPADARPAAREQAAFVTRPNGRQRRGSRTGGPDSGGEASTRRLGISTLMTNSPIT